MNNSSDPAEIRNLLSQITDTAIDKSVAIFTLLYINYGKHTTITKNVFINFDCVFLDLGGITIEDNVPKVSLLSEGHPVNPNDRQSLVPGHIISQPPCQPTHHPAGQILIITDGIGYHQIEGKPIEIIKKGDVVKCPPNVRHWHGAIADVGLQQLYIVPNTGKGIVNWDEAVSNEQYSAIN